MMKKTKKTLKGFSILTILLLMISFTHAHAVGLEIKKTTPEKIKIDEILQVKIEILNKYNESLDIKLREIVDFGEPLDKENFVQEQNFTQDEEWSIINGVKWLNPNGKCDIGCKDGDKICDPDCRCTAREDQDCAAFVFSSSPRYEWRFKLKPDEKKIISYRVKPFSIGTIKISPTTAETKIGTFYSNSLSVEVKCNSNGLCESNENYYNCPEDCSSGGDDGYCDRILDGVCDPNCPKYADPDCLPAKCGDGTCEKEKGESYENCPEDCSKPIVCGDNFCDENENFATCPQDCKSGSRDNYCDGLQDGICDLDCSRNLDPDCLCNNDGFCEIEFENFGNCPEDCLSGLKDNYCDSLKDGKCDPDCKKEEDPDCRANYLLYIILAIFLIIAVFIYKKLKRKEE